MTETANQLVESRVLSAPLQVAFDYTRSTGPVLGTMMRTEPTTAAERDQVEHQVPDARRALARPRRHRLRRPGNLAAS
jgi:hypothetical protein